MQLRSGYKTPPELGDWKYDPDEYDSDFDSKETCNTTKGKGAPASSRDAGASQAQACTEQVPYWVPATLPSCVPGPRHNQQVQPSSSSSSSSFQNDNSNISRNNNSQNACEVQFPLTLSTPSNNLNSLPQPWPLMNGSSIPFPGNNQNVAFPNSLAMRSTGPHLPLQPLGGGAASFFNFDFQTPFPMLFPDIGLGMDLGMGMGMGMGMNVSFPHLYLPILFSFRLVHLNPHVTLRTQHSEPLLLLLPPQPPVFVCPSTIPLSTPSSRLHCLVLLCLHSHHGRALLSLFCCFLALASPPAHTRFPGGLFKYCTNSLSDCFPVHSWPWIQLPFHSQAML